MKKQKEIKKYEGVTLLEVILYMTLFVVCILIVGAVFTTVQETKTNAQIIEDVNNQGKKIIWEISRDMRQGSDIDVQDEEIIIDGNRYFLDEEAVYYQQVGEDAISLSSNRVLIKEFNLEDVSFSEHNDLVEIDIVLESIFTRYDHSVRFYGSAYSRN